MKSFASRIIRARQHLLWIATIPVVGWLSHKVVESAGKENSEKNLISSELINKDTLKDTDESYIYLSKEIVDRFLSDVQDYQNHQNEHDDNDDNSINSLKDKFKDAFNTILYPLTELEGLKHSQMDDYIQSARLALNQDNFNPIFFRPTINVDKLRVLHNDNQIREYELEELMNLLLERVLEIDSNLPDCGRLLAEQTLLLLVESEHFYDVFFHADYNRHFQDRNRTRRYLKLYLQAILENIQTSREKAICLLENGLLILLHRFRKTYPEEQVDKWLTMCLSALSVYEESHKHLFDTGWIGILAELLHSKNLRIHLEARRTLHNIVNHHSKCFLRKSLFLLHDSDQPEFDVVFIHGLRGGVLRTWRQLDSVKKEINFDDQDYSDCWPKSWLAHEFPDSRIVAVNYQTFLSNWNIVCESDSFTLKGRSDKLYDDLITAGLGKRPIIWIAHSMGGLLLKQMLTDEQFMDHQKHSLSNNTVGIVFFSVPNRGSDFAVWSPHMQRIILPSDHVKELRKGSPELELLHQKFVELYNNSNFEILSFGETEKCCVLKKPIEYSIQLVDEESANPGIGKFILLNENHFDICKPRSKQSKSYVSLKDFICDIIEKKSVGRQLHKDLLVSSVI